LRVGFFPTKQAAQRALTLLRDRFPQAWVALAPAEERLGAPRASAVETVAGQLAAEPNKQTQIPTNAPAEFAPLSKERREQLTDEASRAMVAGDYTRAIRIYTKLLEDPLNLSQPEIQEMLGLARARNRQFAHAMAEYERYLQLYPDGEGAARVQQRLAALLTATKLPKRKLRAAKNASQYNQWDVYGGLSQYYRRDVNALDTEGQQVTQSALATDLYLTARGRTGDSDFQAQFSGGYLYDFMQDTAGNDTPVSNMYVDGANRRFGIALRLGRQSRSTGGVLRRFDGAWFSYRYVPWSKINLVAGYPGQTTLNGVERNQRFYGVSFDFGPFSDAWDFNTFLINQRADGITDLRAVGTEIRYFGNNRSFMSLIDYDISFKELNTFLFLGNWTFPNKLTLNAIADYRKSPVLTMSNALQGQPGESLSDLLTTPDEDQVRQLALDRTPDSRSFTIGSSRPLNETLQITGDINLTSRSGTPAFGGVGAIEGTGNDYRYSMQLIGSGLIKDGDITIIGVRYSNLTAAKISSFIVNTRYPVNQIWRISPRLRVDFRQNKDDTRQWVAAPALRLESRWKKRLTLELDAGAEWSNHQLPDRTEKERAYFLSAVYRVDF
jgi:tetratricopeptide (TPR) repeat protein